MADFIVEHYFRHFSLYKFAFTAEVQIDLKLSAQNDDDETSGSKELDMNGLSEESKNLIIECQKLQISAEKEKINRQMKHELMLVERAVLEKVKELAPKS